MLASLNHPNIAGIHGLEESGDTRALVLELVEGPTLADRIAQGPIPVEDALPIARQITEALEAAHGAGVVHRDLKPANVKVKDDGTVKVLDFGLAKALDTRDGDPSQSPTLTAAATQMGVIMGTAAYMAPEQARGRPADRRADIWAFGVVVYEMLTGRRAFEGEDVSLTLASVMKSEPDWDALPGETPPAVRTTLRRCLEKDAAERARDIGDVRHALEGRFESSTDRRPSGAPPVPAVPVWRAPLQWVAAVVVGALVAGAAGWSLFGPPAPPAQVMRFTVEMPTDETLRQATRQLIAVSPDGTHVAFVGTDGLWVRALDAPEPRLLVRGNNTVPFFSPDGLWVGFSDLDSDQIRKVEVDGGAAVTLGDTPTAFGVFGGSWTEPDTVLLGAGPAGLLSLPGTGGAMERMVETLEVDTVQALPGGDWVLVSEYLDSGWAVVALSPTTGAREVLIEGASTPHYLPTGHLVFVRDGTLFGARFDPETRTVSGGSVPLIEQVAHNVDATGVAQLDIADNGLLVYVAGSASQGTRLAWVDRDGRAATAPAEPFPYSDLRLSPDDRKARAPWPG